MENKKYNESEVENIANKSSITSKEKELILLSVKEDLKGLNVETVENYISNYLSAINTLKHLENELKISLERDRQIYLKTHIPLMKETIRMVGLEIGKVLIKKHKKH